MIHEIMAFLLVPLNQHPWYFFGVAAIVNRKSCLFAISKVFCWPSQVNRNRLCESGKSSAVSGWWWWRSRNVYCWPEASRMKFKQINILFNLSCNWFWFSTNTNLSETEPRCIYLTNYRKSPIKCLAIALLHIMIIAAAFYIWSQYRHEVHEKCVSYLVSNWYLLTTQTLARNPKKGFRGL